MIQSVKKICIGGAFVVCGLTVQAQFTKANDDPDANFKLAKEFYQKDQFSLAYPLFKMLNEKADANSSIPVTIQLESKYYSLVCGLQLNDVTAEEKAKEFIAIEHNTPRIEMLCYHLAEYYYRKKKFAEALDYYEKTTPENLSNREIASMKFHKGYAYFTMQRFNDAKPLFNAIRQIPSDPNYYDANYYYGFICFNEKNYKEALTALKLVDGQPSYQNIVPYYVAEIHYFNGDKDKAIEYGEKALSKGGQFYDLRLRQLVGHAYFEKKEFAKALPYLEKYVSGTEKVSREDLYELSYCYYDAQQWKKSIAGFKELGGKEDSLSQNSMYLLADAYLKTNQKASARNAFLFCELNSSNLIQKEISKFNYGKLSYELGYQDVALNELREFVTTYPKADNAAEAKELLVSLLANTNNYKDALELFESLSVQSEAVKRLYPRILCGRAVELINDQQLVQADALLDKVLTLAPYNQNQLPFANFWKGEIAYRTNKYDAAINYMETYLNASSSLGEVTPVNARYVLGYSNLKQENYYKALQYFQQIATTVSASSDNISQDAYVRSADCYFMDKKFAKALQMYETVLNSNLPAADYALFQKAIISGASNKYAEKISLMQSLAQRYPQSSLIADANMEIANAYMANEDFQSAISPLNNLLKNGNEAYKPQAYLKLGVVYYNLNNSTEALNNFKKLVSAYPNSDESDEAVDYIRGIFVEQQKPSEYVAFMRQNGKNVSYSEEDSLNYVTSNIAYENKSYETALSGLAAYLKQYPDGRYVIDASFQVAEIYNGKKSFDNAIKYYDAVAAKAPNRYAEASALQAARISYFELKDYERAEKYFAQLKGLAVTPENKQESMKGLLRCQYKLSKWTEAVPNAEELLKEKGIATDDKMMANMILAKNYQNNNNLEDASIAYKRVIQLGKSEYAAEARYRVAEILFAQNKFPEAEKAGFEVINKAGSYDYWITKAYILLGDVYFKQKDYFNAEATLKSVAENATDTSLKKEATKLLDDVIAEKNQNSKVDPS